MVEVIPEVILLFLLPGWVILGLLDWVCHRRSRIDVHCGPWESMFHLLLLALAGAAILMGLLLELNEPVLCLMALCFALHETVAYLDVRFAHGRRDISPAEQRVHDFMTAVPVSALCLVAVLHWDAVSNLVLHPGSILTEPIQLKLTPLPPVQVIGILVVVLVGDLLPYFEEFVRGLRARRIQPSAG
jgi:hypothetical protein